MHLNYHFLKYLCPELEKVFLGKTISACFSQNKDELIIETEDQTESRYIRAHFLPPQIYFSFPENKCVHVHIESKSCESCLGILVSERVL